MISSNQLGWVVLALVAVALIVTTVLVIAVFAETSKLCFNERGNVTPRCKS